jgi:hypothetical protein
MTFPQLRDAFQEFERRADVASDLIDAPPRRYHRRRLHPLHRRRIGVRATAVVGSAAAVAAVTVGIGFAASGGSHHVASAGNPATGSNTAPVGPSTAVTSATSSAVLATDVPKSQAALIARFRAILGRSATFTLDAAHSTDNLLTGVLTSTSGARGMYVLEVDKNVAICGSMGTVGQTTTPLACPHVTLLADGSELKVDPDFPDGPPDGVMNDAILNRPDGWQISLYTANVQGKYYGAPVYGKEPALTVNEVTDVVTSPQWLA